ncbi:hypothetical protein BDB00DRAFT_281460 [Zychaea mexicana]|uniref:uncharacterized protein n=1 Tax=Zychaea mexicana TaxID=64656 RepID=UPI0022FF21BE|nr:uncharacterized protein BDB00DRAFT_281460 [Zychaea mexicana]KAI9494983.1 hypothetical protein BDB00DRAFT_281460 [Zychaea mexicana]
MLNSHKQPPIQRLSPELTLQLVLCLEARDVVALALTCKHFYDFLLKNDSVFARLVERDYGINYKRTDGDQTWQSFYKDLCTRNAPICCRHLSRVPDEPNETKRVIYRAALQTTVRCDFCHSEDAVFLSMSPFSESQACRSCVKVKTTEEPFPVQLEVATGNLWCMDDTCSRKLGDEEANLNEQHKVKTVMNNLKDEKEGSLDRRRKAEHLLYVQELRREDMKLKHYLVEKQWGRTWMLFRTREGSPLPGKISNHKLARSNGSLDPSIRLPNDKYRPSPETHADIVSEKLWLYLQKAYGVQGKAYSEDDLQYPEYGRLRAYIDDFKTSILAYP